MKHHSLLLAGLFLVGLPSIMWAAKDYGPETMNLKERFNVTGSREAVIFPHRKHQAKLNQECNRCHVSEEGGGKLKFALTNKEGISNDFHKKFCWPCHEEMHVPKGKLCSTCHKHE